MKKVIVVILNYHLKEQTLSCVRSVTASNYSNKSVIVVDNSEDDELSDSDFKRFKEVELISNHRNLGYSDGNNVGIRYAYEQDPEYVFILNPDATVDPDCIKNLVDSFTDNIGIAGPKVLFSDKKTIWYAGGYLDLANALGRHRGVDEVDIGQYDSVQETDYVTGGAIFIKKEVFDKIGYFDGRYFLYYEDSDFCLRAKLAGFKIIFTPKAVVYHNNAQSTGLGSTLQDYYITRNRLLFARKFLTFRTQFALIRESLRNFLNPVRRQAFWDFVSGNFGIGSFRR